MIRLTPASPTRACVATRISACTTPPDTGDHRLCRRRQKTTVPTLAAITQPTPRTIVIVSRCDCRSPYPCIGSGTNDRQTGRALEALEQGPHGRAPRSDRCPPNSTLADASADPDRSFRSRPAPFTDMFSDDEVVVARNPIATWKFGWRPAAGAPCARCWAFASSRTRRSSAFSPRAITRSWRTVGVQKPIRPMGHGTYAGSSPPCRSSARSDRQMARNEEIVHG